MSLAFIEDAGALIEIPQSGMSKRALLQESHVRAMGFGFAAGYELKEHTAPVDVVLHFIDGEAEVTLAGECKTAHVGTIIHIPREIPHSVRALTPVKMLLLRIG